MNRRLFHFVPFVVWLLSVGPTPAAEPKVLALTHATVIDGTGAAAQRDMTVVITGERITALGKSTTLHPPTNAVVVDATGKYLLPGLWDMHVHWYWKEYLPLFLANGVTGVRIMLGLPMHKDWRKEIEAGKLAGPRLVLGSTLVDGPKPIWPGSIKAAIAAEGRQAVVLVKQDGADFVKVYSLLPREAYFAIADEAKRQGIPFAGHIPIGVSVEEASAAGQRSVEHLSGILGACSTREPELLKREQETAAGILATNDPMSALLNLTRQEGPATLESYSRAKARRLFAELKRNDTWQCPTLVVLRNMRHIHDAAITNDARAKYLPRELRVSWDPSLDFRFKGTTAEDFALAERAYLKDLEVVRAMSRAGVGLLAGTDTANPYCFPGFSLHDELGLLVQAGLTPMQALQGATRNAARFLGRENDLGTIAPGKLADLVLLAANPLQDIHNTRRIESVVYGGKLFSRSELDTMLSAAEALAAKSKTPIALTVGQTAETQGIEAAIRRYHELKSAQPEAYDFGEEQLNYLGYDLLGKKRIKDAIQILRLNVEAYPQSANVYDSLGEACMNDGDKPQAIANYEKSLQLDPKNTNAVEKLKQLKAP